MTVKEIVIKYLKEKGFDGLYTEDCGCSIDDLMPCDGFGCIGECEAGVKKDCVKCGGKECTEGCDNDFCIGPKS